MLEHPVLRHKVKELRELEIRFRLHPSLMAPFQVKLIEEWHARQAHMRLLRQLKTCAKSLSDYSNGLDSRKIRVKLQCTVENLEDCLWLLEEK
jgi:hypothetical protein